MATETAVSDGEDVARSHTAACWTVQGVRWKDLVPGLPDDVIALVAPPVVVCVQNLGRPPTV